MFAARDRSVQDPPASARPVSPPTQVRIGRNFRQELQNRPRVFSSLQTLLSAQKLHVPHFQALPDSLRQERNVTTAFPVASGLFPRSFAPEQKSTPLFPVGCELFRENVGVAGAGLMLRSAALAGTRFLARTERQHNCTRQNGVAYSAACSSPSLSREAPK